MRSFDTEPGTDVMPGVVPRTLPPPDRAKPLGPRVIVADPSAGMRAELVEILRADGYDVREACDGLALLDLVAAWHPALVVAAWDLPHFGGTPVPEAIAQCGPHAPRVVVTTATATEEVRREARAHGACAVFPRPFEMDDIRTAVLNLA
ncbi:MAG TPA: response regulator [Polyangiaceae bacterium]